MQPAFPFHTVETSLFRSHPRLQLFRRMPVSDRDISFFPGRMVRQVVLFSISVCISIGPVDDRMHFPNSVLLLDDAELFPSRGLSPPQSGEPAARPRFTDRPIHRFDFVDEIISRQFA